MTDGGSDQERMAQLRRMPLDLVVLYARVTRTFVEVVMERWATGRYVPPHCEPGWVVALADNAALAAQVATSRGATGLG
jgi:hypothetical protein